MGKKGRLSLKNYAQAVLVLENTMELEERCTECVSSLKHLHK